jgi:hypothetical protein
MDPMLQLSSPFEVGPTKGALNPYTYPLGLVQKQAKQCKSLAVLQSQTRMREAENQNVRAQHDQIYAFRFPVLFEIAPAVRSPL